MQHTKQAGLLALLHASFLALPLWKKTIVALFCTLLSPFIAFVVVLTGLSLLPLFLVGQLEGDLGNAPLSRDINERMRRRHARTERYYDGHPVTDT